MTACNHEFGRLVDNHWEITTHCQKCGMSLKEHMKLCIAQACKEIKERKHGSRS